MGAIFLFPSADALAYVSLNPQHVHLSDVQLGTRDVFAPHVWSPTPPILHSVRRLNPPIVVNLVSKIRHAPLKRSAAVADEASALTDGQDGNNE